MSSSSLFKGQCVYLELYEDSSVRDALLMHGGTVVTVRNVCSLVFVEISFVCGCLFFAEEKTGFLGGKKKKEFAGGHACFGSFSKECIAAMYGTTTG